MLGEIYALRMLEKQGFDVSMQTEQKKGDLRAIDNKTGQVFNIEVKTARRNKQRKFQFSVWKKLHTDYRHCDAIILLCVLKSGDIIPFTIPTENLRESRSQITIGNDPQFYAGKWAMFRGKTLNGVLWQTLNYSG
jgi:hypothetical protein